VPLLASGEEGLSFVSVDQGLIGDIRLLNAAAKISWAQKIESSSLFLLG